MEEEEGAVGIDWAAGEVDGLDLLGNPIEGKKKDAVEIDWAAGEVDGLDLLGNPIEGGVITIEDSDLPNQGIKKKQKSEPKGPDGGLGLEGSFWESPGKDKTVRTPQDIVEALPDPLSQISFGFESPEARLYQNLEEAGSLTQDQIDDVNQEIEDESRGDFGFFESAEETLSRGTVSAGFSTGLPTAIAYGQRDTYKSPFQEQEGDLRREFASKYNVPPEEINDKELKGFYLEKRRAELVEKAEDTNREEYISNLPDEDREALKDFELTIHSKINEKNKYRIMSSDKDLADAASIKEDLEFGLVEPSEELALESRRLLERAYDNIQAVAKSQEDLGTIDEEVDLLKRNYGAFENFFGKAGAATLEIFLGLNRFREDIEPFVSPVSYVASMLTGLDKIQDDIIKNIEDIPEEIREGLRKPISASDLTTSNVASWAADVVASQVPNVAILLATGGTAGIATLSSSAYGNKLKSLEKEEELGLADYTALEKRGAALAVGLGEAITELPVLGFLGKAARVFKASAKGVGKEVKKSFVKEFTGNLKNLSKEIAKDSQTEAGAEVLSQLGENVADKYILGKEDVSMYDGLVDAYASGAFMGGVVFKAPQIGAALVKPFTTKDTQQRIGENLVKIKDLTESYEFASEASKPIIEKQVAALDAKNNKALQKTLDGIDNLSKDQVKEVLDSEGQMLELRKEYQAIQKDVSIPVENKQTILENLDNQYKGLSKSNSEIVNNSQFQNEVKEVIDETATVEEDSRVDEGPMKVVESIEEKRVESERIIEEKRVESERLKSQSLKRSKGLSIKESELKSLKSREDLSTKRLSALSVKESELRSLKGKKGESSSTQTDVVESDISVRDALKGGVFTTKDGSKGVISQEGQSVVLETRNEILELGNVDELNDVKLSELIVPLTKEGRSEVEVLDDQSLKIRGEVFKNKFSKPLSAVSYRKDGGINTVEVENEKGQKRFLKGGVAEEVVYQYTLLDFERSATDSQIELLESYIKSEETNIKEIEDAITKKESEVSSLKVEIRKAKSEEANRALKKGREEVKPTKDAKELKGREVRTEVKQEPAKRKVDRDLPKVDKAKLPDGKKDKVETIVEDTIDRDKLPLELPEKAPVKPVEVTDPVEKAKSSLDSLIDFLDQKEKEIDDFSKETLGIGIPILIAKGAIKAMKIAAKTARTLEEVVKVGLDYIKSTKWYQGLSESKKSDLENNLVTRIHEAIPREEDADIAEPKDEDVEKKKKAFEMEDVSGIEGVTAAIAIKIHDTLFNVLKVQKAIEKSRGFKQVDKSQDFTKAEKLLHGAASYQLTLLENKQKEVAIKIADLHKKGYDLKEVGRYVYAKHAIERNDNIRDLEIDSLDKLSELEKNKKKKEKIEKELEERIAVPREDEGGSGMKTSEAREVLAEAQSKAITALSKKRGTETVKTKVDGIEYHVDKDLEAVWNDIQEVNADTRKNLVKFGLMSEKDVKNLENTYENYVSLQGFAKDEMEGSEIYSSGGGSGFSIGGKEFKKALGRESEARNPIFNTFFQSAKVLIRGHKNKTIEKLYNLAKEYPNDEIWELYSDKNPDTKPGFNNRIKRSVVEDMHDKKKYVSLKIKGESFYIKLKNQQMTIALNKANDQRAHSIVRFVGYGTRYLSAMFTTFSPNFILINPIRDATTAIYAQLAESDISVNTIKGKNVIKGSVKAIPISVKAIIRNERGLTPKKELTSKYDKYYQEFKEDGAKTGWAYQASADEFQSNIESIIKLRTSKSPLTYAKKAKNAIFNLVEDTNMALENGLRLSTYVKLREAGADRSDAAAFAKEMTINFNKSGEWGPNANALYAFFNSAISGSAQMIKTLATLKKTVNEDGSISTRLNKAQKLAMGAVAFSGLLTVLNSILSEDDEDGESYYSKIPKYKKERNLIIMDPFNGKNYYSIPLPYGYNVLNVIGMSVAEVSMGEETAGASFLGILNAIIGSFSPLPVSSSSSLSGTAIQTITPTVLKPFAELWANENVFGSRIFRKNFPTDLSPTPESHLGKERTSSIFKNTSKFLNEVMGGSQYVTGPGLGGYLDINPDKPAYLFDYYSGGIGRFFANSATTLENMMLEYQGAQDLLEIGKVPIVRNFYGVPSKYIGQTKYYERRKIIGQRREEFLKAREKDKSGERYKGVTKLYNKLTAVEKSLKAIRASKKSAGDMKDPVKRANRLNFLDKLYYRKIASFNKMYVELRGD